MERGLRVRRTWSSESALLDDILAWVSPLRGGQGPWRSGCADEVTRVVSMEELNDSPKGGQYYSGWPAQPDRG